MVFLYLKVDFLKRKKQIHLRHLLTDMFLFEREATLHSCQTYKTYIDQERALKARAKQNYIFKILLS